MSDVLRMDYINSLPQPFIAHFYDGYGWPVETIDVETGLIRIDIMGKIDCCHIGDVKTFVDCDGNEHDPDSFYVDYESPQETSNG